ncbi:von Willebrand factor A [Marinosulfonomonas sp. PRT-SC04]|nr:von Willebrand factor A [Marinosulfonomonas sp. PRT-SC04]
MSDDLQHLKNALRAATPAPSKKVTDLALAMKNFDDLQTSRQGSPDEARHNPDRPTLMSRLTSGALDMFHNLTTRSALAATTSITAVGIGVFFYTQQGDIRFELPSPDPTSIAVPTEQPTAPATIVQMDDAQMQGAVQKDIATAPMVELEEGVMSGQPSPSFAAPMLTRKAAPMGKIANGIVAYNMEAPLVRPEPNTETFANADSNPVKITGDDPVSTFSIDVDTASYSVMRSSLMNGHLPDEASVRIEEMINYFPYDYPAPTAGEAPFKPTVTVFQTPWNAATQLVHIGIQGTLPAADDRPALNLVFLIDTSGSMNQPNKLPLLIQSFRLMLSELHPDDEVSIVTYAGSAGQVLKPTKIRDKAKIMAALTQLSAGGSTAGQQGLQQAYAVAESMRADGEISRIILATDGDFNVGISDPEQLKDYISKKRDSGTYLSVLGFGRGNLNDATMQALAQNGNGQAAYIDTLSEAQKVLVDQLGGALFPIANDVKIQVEFNPAMVAEYRLIGYETRALAREDFNNDKVDAGEIGAGHTVTAIYEITPVGSEAILNDALRYQPAVKTDGNGELGFLKLRYKTPGEDVSQLLSTPIIAGMGEVSDDIRFSAAIAGYGQLLSGGKYLQDWGYDALINMANQNKGEDAYGYRSEAIKLMRLAKSLSTE